MLSAFDRTRKGVIGAGIAAFTLLGACSNDDNHERLLDPASDAVERTTVVNDYSLSGNQYGRTNDFFHFADDQTVIFIRLDDSGQQDISIEATVNLFDRAASKDAIGKWISNQHSDGLHPDAASPVGVYEVVGIVQIASRTFDRTTSGVNGDEYEIYTVEVSVDESKESGEYILPAFTYQTQTYVRTRGANQP